VTTADTALLVAAVACALAAVLLVVTVYLTVSLRRMRRGQRLLLGADRCARVLPLLKALNLVDLLLLNYANASVALPQIVRRLKSSTAAIIRTAPTTTRISIGSR